jgi:hypothetical protein
MISITEPEGAWRHAGAENHGVSPIPSDSEARCAEYQADGVPCASVVTACAECPRAEAGESPGAEERPAGERQARS